MMTSHSSPCLTTATSGSITNPAGPFGLFETRDQHYWRTRGSVAYVSGSHHAKFGYDGGYYKQLETNTVSNNGLLYNYASPAATAVCLPSTNPAINPCGNLLAAQFPNDPFNFTKRPIPSSVQWSDGAVPFDEMVRYDALYAQDQWTISPKLTLNYGARYELYPAPYRDHTGAYRLDPSLPQSGNGPLPPDRD